MLATKDSKKHKKGWSAGLFFVNFVIFCGKINSGKIIDGKITASRQNHGNGRDETAEYAKYPKKGQSLKFFAYFVCFAVESFLIILRCSVPIFLPPFFCLLFLMILPLVCASNLRSSAVRPFRG